MSNFQLAVNVKDGGNAMHGPNIKKFQKLLKMLKNHMTQNVILPLVKISHMKFTQINDKLSIRHFLFRLI